MINKSDIKKILITRTDSLGDVMLTLPLINETRKLFGDAKIYFLVKEYAGDIVRNYPGIDETVIMEDIPGFMKKYNYFLKKKFDLVINVKPEFILAFLFFVSKIKYRIGTAYRWYSFLYNCKVREHRKHSEKHESEYNINLLKTFFDEVNYNRDFYLKYSGEERISLNNKLSGLLDKKYIIIHPGSRGSAKDLPAERFTVFSDKILSKHPGLKIVITGVETEKTVISSIADSLRKRHSDSVSDLSGKLNLRELMILIDNSQIFISNSTGPIHIAGALNKSIIGFYPNEKVISDVRWRPLSDKAVILKPSSGNDNMNEIKDEEIMNSVSKFIN